MKQPHAGQERAPIPLQSGRKLVDAARPFTTATTSIIYINRAAPKRDLRIVLPTGVFRRALSTCRSTNPSVICPAVSSSRSSFLTGVYLHAWETRGFLSGCIWGGWEVCFSREELRLSVWVSRSPVAGPPDTQTRPPSTHTVTPPRCLHGGRRRGKLGLQGEDFSNLCEDNWFLNVSRSQWQSIKNVCFNWIILFTF